MTHRVLLFASWADALGTEIHVDLPSGATVADLLTVLRNKTDGRALPRPVVAVNHRYAKPDAVLSPRDEIALIPPVAGG